MHRESIYHQEWYADQYDKEKFGAAFGRYLYDQEVEGYLSLIDNRHRKVLDVGTGTGKLSLPLLSQSRHVVSSDASPEMLRIAKTKALRKGMALKTIVCDAHSLSFEDNEFDCVVCSRTLMHLVDWRKGISELCRVSRDAVVLDFPPLLSFGFPGALIRRVKSLFAPGTQTYNVFSTGSVVRELKRNGFRVVVQRKQFFLPLAFHRWLDRPLLSRRIEGACRMIGLVGALGAPVTLKSVRDTTGRIA